MQFKQIKNDLMEALAANKPKTAPYDTEAQVVRVEGSTAWVHIPGGVDETPVAMTINASAGDTVRVRVGNGTAWLVGNDTAPPTDDYTAIIASRQAAQAAAIARKTVELTEDLNQRIANANGLYETRITQPGGATITYMHNKSNLADSDIQMMISDVGVLVTANGTDASPTWYGLTVDGNLIANILRANGINADWINTGALVIYDNDGNEIFRADKTNKVFHWDMAHSSLSNTGYLTLRDTDNSGAAVTVNGANSSKYSAIHSTGFHGYNLSSGDQYSIGASLWAWQNTGHIYGEPAPNIWQVFSVEGSDQNSGMYINNRTLESRIFEAAPYPESAYIAQGTNVNNIRTVGNYFCAAATIASTLTNAPFTDSAFQMTVWKFGSMYFQLAWQNKQDSYIKYRIYTSSNAWGSWIPLQKEGVAYKTGTVTIASGTQSTVTQTINFSDVVPSGKVPYGVVLTIGSYQLPYINASGNVVTWISNLSNTSVTISNKTSAWSNYKYYLTVFFH